LITTAGPIRRIHVVGGPGSGKTTLAARLGRRLGVVAHDLDDVALSEGADADFRPIRGIASRRSDVLQLSEAATWVTEGTYLWWTEPLFRRADKIIWLDVSWGIAASLFLGGPLTTTLFRNTQASTAQIQTTCAR
jgi:adenylate kinase family enzyme